MRRRPIVVMVTCVLLGALQDHWEGSRAVAAGGQGPGASMPPTVGGVQVTPDPLRRSAAAKIVVDVAPGTNPASTGLQVMLDLSALGGLSATPLSDAGAGACDETAGDRAFSVCLFVPSTVVTGPLMLQGVVRDDQGRTAPVSMTTAVAADVDSDTDGLADDCESSFGIDTSSSTGQDGAAGDPDNDGLTNADECGAGTHPRGSFRRYLAEGVSNSFFQTRIALFNPSTSAVAALVRVQPEGAAERAMLVTVPGLARRTIVHEDLLTVAAAPFATVVESETELAVDRLVSWGAGTYGSHAETAVKAPSTTWYLAEGATGWRFSLFYLLQNPTQTEAQVRVSYLRGPGEPVLERFYVVGPRQRRTIPVDDEQFPEGSGITPLSNTDVSAVVTSLNSVPIVVERAMYMSPDDQAFGAGHAGAGITAPSTQWFFAEGATGSFFDEFILLANPGNDLATVTVTYSPEGRASFDRAYDVAPHSRRTIWVDQEPGLEGTSVSARVVATVPIVAERAMWWPGSGESWREAHVSAGATSTGPRWAVADLELGGPFNAESYVLVANGGTVTVYFDDGTAPATCGSAGQGRVTFHINECAGVTGKRFVSVIVDGTPQTVVERAVYYTTTSLFEAGGASLAAQLSEISQAASVEVDRTTARVGTAFTLTARGLASSAPIARVEWDLGDGRTAAGPEISVTYATAGAFAPTATVFYTDGTTARAQASVLVYDAAGGAGPLGLPAVMGDVTNDRALTLEDAHLIGKQAGGLGGLTTDQIPAADLDLDGHVTRADAILAARAVVSGQPLPTALLPDQGTVGTIATLVSPRLLDPDAFVEVEVGASALVQRPFRPIPGYATIVIPFDPSTPNGPVITPGWIDVRLRVNGTVVTTVPFLLQATPPITAPVVEARALLGQIRTLFTEQDATVGELMTFVGVTGRDRDVLQSILTASRQDADLALAQLDAMLDGPDGEIIARFFVMAARANNTAAQGAAATAAWPSSLAATVPDPVCDEMIPTLCRAKTIAERLEQSGTVVGTSCDVMLVAGLAASIYYSGGTAAGAALVAWAGACGALETSIDVADIVGSVVRDIRPEVGLTASTTTPGANETVRLTTTVTFEGLQELCKFAGGQAVDKINEKIATLAVKKLLKRKLALRAVAALLMKLSPRALDTLTERLKNVVQGSLEKLEVAEAFKNLAASTCATFGGGLPQEAAAENLLKGPTPAAGTLTFPGDKSAAFRCSGTTTANTVAFAAEKDICGIFKRQTLSISCQGGTVTITMGDNGTANDDIFEVRVDGTTVLTSSTPVRSISKTLSLTNGEHTVQMIGRAAPDGVGTYFISFSGATVISGAPLSGSDLTPGVVKTFRIRVP